MIDPAILHYCKYQERCHSEVRNKLYELGFGKTDVEYQISELISAGVLNEERFARAFARGKWRMLKWGRVKITQQLKAKKVSDYCIKKGLSEIDGEEYEAILLKIAEKKAEELKKERNIRAKMAKMQRFLLQKGYEQDLVKYALEIALKQN
jgi:regulatory protein